MPKWVYDPKTASMVPVKHTNELEFQMTGAGFKISDHKHNLIFTIGPDDSISFNDRGIHQYLFTDYRTAATVAQRIRRVYPNSRFATAEGLLSWRRGAHPELDHPHYNESMSADDKAMLRCLLEEVDAHDIDKYVESLNETGYWIGLGGKSSVGQTPGTTQHGLKGALNALPSMVLSFLVCPPATILRWIGAVRARSEKRWLKTRINPNRWLDFVATPWERENAKKELNDNSQYYYTRLANGEILRVVGSSTLEAKEMVMAIEHKDIIPRYAEWNNKLSLTARNSDDTVSISPAKEGSPEYIMWVIKFKNGEACYAFGKPDASDKEEIKEKAIESRKAIVDYYKKIKYHDEDNGDRKTQRHPGLKYNGENEDLIELFKVPEIDDMIRITSPSSYKIIGEDNYKDFETPTTNRLEWQPNGDIVYKINFNNIGTVTLPLRSPLEVKTVLSELVKAEGEFGKQIATICNCGRRNYTHISCTKVIGTTDDRFIIPTIDSAVGSNITLVEPHITEREAKDIFLKLENCIKTVIENADISKESKLDFRKYHTNDREARVYVGVSEPDNFDNVYNKSWSKRISYQKIDSKSGKALSDIDWFDGGIDDDNIEGNPLPPRAQAARA